MLNTRKKTYSTEIFIKCVHTERKEQYKFVVDLFLFGKPVSDILHWDRPNPKRSCLNKPNSKL